MTVSGKGFLRPLVAAYSTLPLHGRTGIPGKIAGALWVASAIRGCVPLIHGPIGCSFQRKVNPFAPYLMFYETPCTDMDDVDVVYGGEDKLRLAIKETYERYHPDLIMVITTCASDMIGDDVRAIVDDVKAKRIVGCEVIYTTGDLTGKKARSVGVQDALYAIADQMLCNCVERGADTGRVEGSVNIVTLPIHSPGLRVAEMVSTLREMGVKVNKVCFYNTTVKDLYELPRAALNVIDYPMEWARLMKERLGIDYYALTRWDVVDPELTCPYGVEGSARVFMEIAKMVEKEGEAEEVVNRKKKEAMEKLSKVKEGLEGKRVAFVTIGVHDSLMVMALRDMGMKVSAVVFKTRDLERTLSKRAVERLVSVWLEWTRKYSPDAEFLIDPTIEEEIRVLKRAKTDLVIISSVLSAAAHHYNREGMRTFSSSEFTHRLRVGFKCPVEFAIKLKEALKKPKRRNPLLGMLKYDSYRCTLTPHWAGLADMFRAVREGAVEDEGTLSLIELIEGV